LGTSRSFLRNLNGLASSLSCGRSEFPAKLRLTSLLSTIRRHHNLSPLRSSWSTSEYSYRSRPQLVKGRFAKQSLPLEQDYVRLGCLSHGRWKCASHGGRARKDHRSNPRRRHCLGHADTQRLVAPRYLPVSTYPILMIR